MIIFYYKFYLIIRIPICKNRPFKSKTVEFATEKDKSFMNKN